MFENLLVRLHGVVPFADIVDLLNQMCIDLLANHSFHHCEMLQIVMSLEQSITSEKFDQDAPYTPDITWIRPTQL